MREAYRITGIWKITVKKGERVTVRPVGDCGLAVRPGARPKLRYDRPTVNADCTGTFKALSVGATSEMFIAPNGDEMTVISSDNGHVEAYSSWRVGPE
jgi:hypothetical protein